MKSVFILPLLAIGPFVVYSHAQLPGPHAGALLERAIDGSTMDPVRFSVLSVLKTAMPTGPDVALPTGNVDPDWYEMLPQDVKDLLPSLYPVTTSTAVASTTGVMVYATASSDASSGYPLDTISPLCSTSKTSDVYIPSPTVGTNSTAPSPSRPANLTWSTGFSPSAPPLPSLTSSTGTNTAIRTETLTTLVCLGLAAAAFLIFA